MFGEVFYHNSTRKYANLFGNMFNDIVIRRFDKNRNVLQNITVPITFAGKQKYIRLEKDPEGQKVAVTLPRMAFSIVNYQFDRDRQINPIEKNKVVLNNKVMKTTFVEQPWLIDFELAIMARNMDDAAQIFEQIAPYFTPSFTAELVLVPEMNLKYDIKTTLVSNTISDEFEGIPEETRRIIWTLNFTMNAVIIGPMSNQGVIKRAIVDFIPVGGTEPITQENVDRNGRIERVTTTPGLTADGEPTSDPALTIPYTDINPDDPYGFIETIEGFDDGLKWNPKTGRDE